MNKIYYAHHLWKYTTKIEEYELEVIRRYFPNAEIINPNGCIEQNRDEEIIMKDCLNIIKECDIMYVG